MSVCTFVCLYSTQINVVKENRVYSMWKASNGGTVTGASGILRAKAKLNQLHQELADQGFSQVKEGGWAAAVIQRQWELEEVAIQYISSPGIRGTPLL